MISARRFASVAGDQGIPAYEEVMREWELQPAVASLPKEEFGPAEREQLADVARDLKLEDVRE